MPRRKPFNFDELADTLIDRDDDLGEIDIQALAAQLPPGVDPQRLLDAIGEFGNSAIFLDEELIGLMCGPRAFEKGRKLYSAGQIVLKSFDGKTISGIVADGNRRYEPEFEFKLNSFGCNCAEPGIEGCSHIAALMLAWIQGNAAFLQTQPSREDLAMLGRGPYGQFMMAVTGEKSFLRALERISELQAQAGGQAAPGHLLPDKAQSNISTGAAFWPTASSIRMNPPSLKQTIEAEFNTAQLRELAKWLGLKLKGNAKSAYVEQVAAELSVRAGRLRETPEALVAGLTDDQAAFVRRALTARDYYLPLPRNLANALWSQLVNRDPDKHLADMLDALRRRAVLFPTHVYVGYRDVYYQWLPLEASGGNVPLMMWPRGPITTRGQTHRPAGADAPNFLDALDLLISAVMSTGAEVRPHLPPHTKASSTAWLKDWEHQAEEADRLLNSRPGWVPNPQSGISVPLLSPLTSEALTRLQNQTGLSGAHIEFLFEIAATLQLIEAPDPLASARNSASAKRLQTAWRVNTRASAMEEWFALTDEVKLARAWNAWREQMAFACEIRRAAGGYGGARKENFQVIRAIGARELTPAGLAAEWCSLRRYVARVLCGLPGDQWIGWPELRKLLFEFYPDCAWTMFNQDNWWFSAPGKVGRLDINRPDDWKRTIGAIIETMLIEPLRWFGVIEVTEPGEHGLEAFRLTELLEWLRRIQSPLDNPEQTSLFHLPTIAAARPRQAEAVAWLDDTQWRLPPAPDRAEFISFARKIAEPAGAPFTYALTPLSVEHALTQGITLDEIACQFEAYGAAMPAQAQAMFRSIAERFGRVRIYEALTVLQLADNYALRELLANTSLAQHIIYQLSPRAVVVADSAVDALAEEMVARGYTPGVL